MFTPWSKLTRGFKIQIVVMSLLSGVWGSLVGAWVTSSGLMDRDPALALWAFTGAIVLAGALGLAAGEVRRWLTS